MLCVARWIHGVYAGGQPRTGAALLHHVSALKFAMVPCESQKIHVDMQSNFLSDPIPPAGVSVDVECDDV